MPLLILSLALFAPRPLLESAPALQISPTISCVLDGYEPNNRRKKARTIKALAAGRLCDGDTDWLAFKAERGDRVRLELQGHDVYASLYPPRARRVRKRLKAGDRVIFRVRRSGRHKLRVQGAVGSYRLRVEHLR